MKQHKAISLSILSIFAFPSFAYANPMTPIIGVPGIFIALALESILLAFLVKSYAIRPYRFIAAWFLITCGTFGVMTLFILGAERIHIFQNLGITILVAESLVVIAEALILCWLLTKTFVLKNQSKEIGMVRAFLYSFIVNAVSFISGFVMLTLSTPSEF